MWMKLQPFILESSSQRNSCCRLWKERNHQVETESTCPNISTRFMAEPYYLESPKKLAKKLERGNNVIRSLDGPSVIIDDNWIEEDLHGTNLTS